MALDISAILIPPVVLCVSVPPAKRVVSVVSASRDGELDEMIPDWRTFLSEPDEQDFAEAIRRETAAGRPLGDDRFVRRLEKRIGRKLARGRPGWPKGRRRGRRKR